MTDPQIEAVITRRTRLDVGMLILVIVATLWIVNSNHAVEQKIDRLTSEQARRTDLQWVAMKTWVAMFRAQNPDLVIPDLEFPEVNGNH